MNDYVSNHSLSRAVADDFVDQRSWVIFHKNHHHHRPHPVAEREGGGKLKRRSLLFTFKDSPLIRYAIAWAALSAASLLDNSFNWPVSEHFLRNLPGGFFEYTASTMTLAISIFCFLVPAIYRHPIAGE
mmetsp:Transcript_5739/g.9406  ORF Transcript_5739/g.9406 Transcript_5739/m.9406 type:complete len:129 (+) Transcript_5739:875-1261(+)